MDDYSGKNEKRNEHNLARTREKESKVRGNVVGRPTETTLSLQHAGGKKELAKGTSLTRQPGTP